MSARPRFGAEEADWIQFDMGLDLTEDLLPVVSNPNATISPHSTLKALGKTPSLYNANREVVGIPNWTSRKSTPDDIAEWEQEPDYGICIQTRRLRAIDIDVEDPDLAQRIARAFERSMGIRLPKRWRENSGKCLLVFLMPGHLTKRSFRVEGGQVEILGNGQQFIACGTHPSGARYRWSH